MNSKDDDDDDLTKLIDKHISQDEQSIKSSTVELEEMNGVLPSTYSPPNDEADASKITELLHPDGIQKDTDPIHSNGIRKGTEHLHSNSIGAASTEIKAFTMITGKTPPLATNGNGIAMFSVKTPFSPEIEDKHQLEAVQRSEKARRHWAIVRAHVFSKKLSSSGKQQKNARGFFSKRIFGDSKTGFLRNDDDDAELGELAKTREEQEQEAQHGSSSSSSSGTSDSYIREAIPFLPRGAAAVCLVLNIVLPGSGTMLSGVLVLCCGKSRLVGRDNSAGNALCVNVFVGLMQLFTVTLMLVGWIWSLVWGIYLVILAQEYRKDEKMKRQREVEKKVINVMNKGLQWQLRT